MTPLNALAKVRCLAASEASCSFFGVVLEELRCHGLDTEDLREIICSELGEMHCFDSKETRKYHPGTISDYYSIWVDVCGARMFLKLLVDKRGSTEMLVVTSFKKDTNYD